MRDGILEDLWRIKDQIAAEANGDTRALFERLRAVKLAPSQRLANRASQPRKQRAGT